MPARGVPNNPTGANGASDAATGTTSAAGQIQHKLGTTTGPNAPGLTAPKQAQRHAVKPAGGAAAPQEVMLHAPPAAPPPLTYEQQLSQVWTQVAATPGASDLVQQIAQEAQGV